MSLIARSIPRFHQYSLGVQRAKRQTASTYLCLPSRTPTGIHLRNPTFSTTTPSTNKPQNPDPKQNPNPQLPKISLEGLGISKNVRIVLYTLLGIWGTFETYFYYQAVMRWWRGKNRGEDKSEEVE
ncbi:hypothetical protein BJY04DRAFT_188093 [Aspergillus karnatakaensis]|uniref:uncharacterized protein n=1 Tax=Aspergillus karnatakaensis TaxID=1810916 RepID=UPI003CCDD98E